MSARNRAGSAPRENDSYPTPPWAVLAALPMLAEELARITATSVVREHSPEGRRFVVLDPCCGEGAYLLAMKRAGFPMDALYGNEIRPEGADATRRGVFEMQEVYGESGAFWIPTSMEPHVQARDFLADEDALVRTGVERWIGQPVDAVVSNPPYGGSKDLAGAFLRRCLRVVRPGGVVIFLLRVNWPADGRTSGRTRFLHSNLPARIQHLNRRPSFMENGGADATTYAHFCWRVGQNPFTAEYSLLDCSTVEINRRLEAVGLLPVCQDEPRRPRGRRPKAQATEEVVDG